MPRENAADLADRVGVMSQGKLEQLAAPAELYANPATPFVASFVGINNTIPTAVEAGGTVQVLGRTLSVAAGSDDIPVGGSANALLRPEAIMLEDGSGSADGAVRANVTNRSFLGPVTRLELTADGGQHLLVDLPSTIARNFQVGANVIARAMTNEVVVHNQKRLVESHD